MHGISQPFAITSEHVHKRNEPVANAHNASGIHTHCAAEGRRAHDSKCSAQGRPGAGWAEREGPGCGAVRCLARPRRGMASGKARGGKRAYRRRVGERGSAPHGTGAQCNSAQRAEQARGQGQGGRWRAAAVRVDSRGSGKGDRRAGSRRAPVRSELAGCSRRAAPCGNGGDRRRGAGSNASSQPPTRPEPSMGKLG